MRIANAPVETSSNHQGKEFEGRLNTAKLGLFMKNLISNYNNAEMATLREWVSNAHDSHVAAGQKKPVRVTLPTRFASVLTVEDWGTGMSYEDVQDTYAVFLTSTKDQDDEGIGGFGIGGKSALALADQYTMVAIKDGLKNVFIFERSDNGGFKGKPVIHNQPTDEPNGVKVSVAVNNSKNFSQEEVTRVLEGWRPEEIELVGGDFKSFYEDAVETEHGVFKNSLIGETENYYSRRSALVFVGPVAYPMPRSFMHSYYSRTQKSGNLLHNFGHLLAVKVNIGSVTFPSSREVIEDTEENNMVILEAVEKFESEIDAYVAELVSKFKNIREAYSFANSSFAVRSGMPITYNGRKLDNVQYSGVRAFAVQRSNQNGDGIRLEKIGHNNHTVSQPAKQVSAVVKLKKDELELSDDTLRKYVRGTAVNLYKEAMQARNYYSRNVVILFTEEHDELHEVTSKVYEYSELRKTTPVSASSKRTRLNEEERKKRAEDIRVAVLDKDRDWYFTKRIPFKEHPAYSNGDPVIITGARDLSSEIISVIEYVLDLKDRVVLVDNKQQRKQIEMVFPEGKSLEAFLSEVSEAKKTAQLKRFEELAKLKHTFGLSMRDVSILKDILKGDQVTAAVRELLPVELLQPSASLPRILSVWNSDEMQLLEKHLGARKSEFDCRNNQPRSPFSLLNTRADRRDLVDYLNWVAARATAK